MTGSVVNTCTIVQQVQEAGCSTILVVLPRVKECRIAPCLSLISLAGIADALPCGKDQTKSLLMA